jgi:hypothetical protein
VGGGTNETLSGVGGGGKSKEPDSSLSLYPLIEPADVERPNSEWSGLAVGVSRPHRAWDR